MLILNRRVIELIKTNNGNIKIVTTDRTGIQALLKIKTILHNVSDELEKLEKRNQFTVGELLMILGKIQEKIEEAIEELNQQVFLID